MRPPQGTSPIAGHQFSALSIKGSRQSVWHNPIEACHSADVQLVVLQMSRDRRVVRYPANHIGSIVIPPRIALLIDKPAAVGICLIRISNPTLLCRWLIPEPCVYEIFVVVVVVVFDSMGGLRSSPIPEIFIVLPAVIP